MSTPIPLDRRVTESSPGVSVAFDGTFTTWTIPYSVPTDGSDGILQVVRTDTREAIIVTRPTATTARATGNYLGLPVTLGVSVLFFWQFSILYPRDAQTGAADIRGRTAVRYVKLHYERATSFTVSVATTGRAVKTYTFAAADPAVPETGIFSIPVQSQNVETCISVTAQDTGLAGFSGYEWEGTFYRRMRAR